MMEQSPYNEGSLSAPICLIGEAPSTVEMERGRPFVGPAGHVLDPCLHQAGLLRRSGVRIVNFLRSPTRNIDKYVMQGKGLTTAGKEAAADLYERISAGSHTVLVPMGNPALCAVSGMQQITKRRGSPMYSDMYPGKLILPTIHPAATLPGRGKYIWIYDIVADLRKAKALAADPDNCIPQRNLIIDPSFDEAMSFIQGLMEVDEFGFDLEVYNYQISCLSFAPDPYTSMSIPFLDRWRLEQEIDLWMAISKLLSTEGIMKIGQNILGFDIPFLYDRNRIVVAPPYGDCMIAQRILYPDFPASLEYLCSIRTNEPYYKDDRKLWNKPYKDKYTFWRYNCKDSAVVMEIWPKLVKDMVDDGYWDMYKRTMRLANPVLYMMAKGLRVDLDGLESIKKEVSDKLVSTEKELEEVSDYPFNPASSKQCIQYFYVHKGYTPYLNRKTRRPTCDDTAMARLARKYNSKEAQLVQSIRGLRKLRDTYLEMKFDPDNYLRCSYSLRGTVSGRLSSSKTLRGTGMNNQNLDPRFKHFITTDMEGSTDGLG